MRQLYHLRSNWNGALALMLSDAEARNDSFRRIHGRLLEAAFEAVSDIWEQIWLGTLVYDLWRKAAGAGLKY